MPKAGVWLGASDSPAREMIPLLLGHPPGFYVIATAILFTLLGLVTLGHAVLGLLRNLRAYRDGR